MQASRQLREIVDSAADEPAGLRAAARARILGTSNVAQKIREYPWHNSPLGAIETWPDTLITNLNLILYSPLPLAIYWGPELVQLANDATRAMFGTRHANVLGQTAPQLWADNWPQVKHQFEAVLTVGCSFEEESACFLIPRDGRADEIFLDYSLSPIYHDGKVAGVLRTFQETTECVLTMRALAESNERLRMALSVGGGFGVWDADVQSGMVFGDETIAKLFGLDPELAARGIPRNVYNDRIPAEDLTAMDDAVLECIRTGNPYNVVYRLRRDDGSSIRVRTMGRCIFDERGHATRVTGLTTELTATPEHTAEPPNPLTDLFRGSQWDRLPLHVRSFIAATLYFVTDEPEKISVQVHPGPDSTQIVIGASPDDLGKLIGKQGRTVRALRTLLLAINKTSTHRYSIDIQDGRRLRS